MFSLNFHQKNLNFIFSNQNIMLIKNQVLKLIMKTYRINLTS